MKRIELTPSDDCFSYSEGAGAEFAVVEWYKSVGENMQEGEEFCLIDVQKTTIDLPSPATGVLVEIRCPENNDKFYPRGTVIGVLEVR